MRAPAKGGITLALRTTRERLGRSFADFRREAGKGDHVALDTGPP